MNKRRGSQVKLNPGLSANRPSNNVALESGFENIRIRCRIRRMRVDGSRTRKEKVADWKISGYVWTGRYIFAQSFGKQRASVHETYKCMLIQKHSSLRTNLSKCGEQSYPRENASHSSQSRLLSRAALAWPLATSPNGELARRLKAFVNQNFKILFQDSKPVFFINNGQTLHKSAGFTAWWWFLTLSAAKGISNPGLNCTIVSLHCSFITWIFISVVYWYVCERSI